MKGYLILTAMSPLVLVAFVCAMISVGIVYLFTRIGEGLASRDDSKRNETYGVR